MFVMPDLVVESVIREGFESLKTDPTPLDNILSQFSDLGPVMEKKYGDAMINQVRKDLFKQDLRVVQSFSQVTSNVPCVSVQLLNNAERRAGAHLEDHEDEMQTTFTDPEDIQSTIILDNIAIDNYDKLAGQIDVADGVDLSDVYPNHLIEDVNGDSFRIQSVDEDSGILFIDPGSEFDPSGNATVKSSINYSTHTERGVMEDESLLLGIHTGNRILTIVMYTLIKYFLLSRKKDLDTRGFQNFTYSASDFNRNGEYSGDVVYDRFLTVSGLLQHNWKGEQVVNPERFDITTLVPKDDADNDDLGLNDSTIQVT